MTFSKNIEKDNALHALMGDIQTAGINGLDKKEIEKSLAHLFVGKFGITADDFHAALDEQYAKILEWRKSK